VASDVSTDQRLVDDVPTAAGVRGSTGMAVADPEAWVRNVERLYQAHDAVGVAALYTPQARTKFGSRVLTPQEVHDHPAEWFDSLDDYVLTARSALLVATSSSARRPRATPSGPRDANAGSSASTCTGSTTTG